MVRTLRAPLQRTSVLVSGGRQTATAVGLAALCTLLLSLTGCSGSSASSGETTASVEASAPVGQRMAGVPQKVVISRETVDNKPYPPVLTSPQAAVRSYLEWISYAYRIAESPVALPTMSDEQEVRVDSYVQLNLQKSRLIDQRLDSITFGKPSTEATRVVLPAREKWTYRYVSIAEAGKTIGGPFPATYDTTYTVVKNQKGDWVVDAVKVKVIGEIK